MEEYDNFNKQWDDKMNEFQQHAIQLIKALEDKLNKTIERLFVVEG